jgi:hypothetical protein
MLLKDGNGIIISPFIIFIISIYNNVLSFVGFAILFFNTMSFFIIALFGARF